MMIMTKLLILGILWKHKINKTKKDLLYFRVKKLEHRDECTLKMIGWREILVTVSLCSKIVYSLRILEQEKINWYQSNFQLETWNIEVVSFIQRMHHRLSIKKMTKAVAVLGVWDLIITVLVISMQKNQF